MKVICTEINEKGSRVLILAGNSLQYWYFPHDDQKKMEFDEDIGQLFTHAFVKKFWVCKNLSRLKKLSTNYLFIFLYHKQF